MEALGIVGAAAAIIQLAGVGMALAKTLYAIYDEGASSPERLKELYTYVQSTSLVLDEIGKVFEEEGHMAKPLISETAIAVAHDVVARCSSTFDMIRTMADDAQKNTMGLLVFSLKGTRLRALQGRLDQSKIDLQLMLQVIIYARIKKSQSRLPDDEAEQRQVVEELVKQRNQPPPSASHVEHNLTLATDTFNATSATHSHRQTPLSARRARDNNRNADGNAVPPAEEDTFKDRSPPNNAPDQSKPPTHSSNPTPANPGPDEWESSYLSALYFVCCPCRPRRKQKTEYDQSQPPILPPTVWEYSKTPRKESLFVVSRGARQPRTRRFMRDEGRWAITNANFPPVVDQIESRDSPQVESGRTYVGDSGYELRVNDRLNDLPMADAEPPQSSPLYVYESAITESTNPSLDELKKKQETLSTIATKSGSVRNIQSEVDRLLHLWTTIDDVPTTSDVPSITIQSASEESREA